MNNDELTQAIENNNLSQVKEHINKKNINRQENNPLIIAAGLGRQKIVEFLLKAGSDIHIDNDYALRIAAMNKKHSTVSLLLENGADIHANNDFALKWSTWNEDEKTSTILIKNGADASGLTSEVQKNLIHKIHKQIEFEKDLKEEKRAEFRNDIYTKPSPNNDEELLIIFNQAIDLQLDKEALEAASKLSSEALGHLVKNKNYSGFVLTNWQVIQPLIKSKPAEDKSII